MRSGPTTAPRPTPIINFPVPYSSAADTAIATPPAATGGAATTSSPVPTARASLRLEEEEGGGGKGMGGGEGNMGSIGVDALASAIVDAEGMRAYGAEGGGGCSNMVLSDGPGTGTDASGELPEPVEKGERRASGCGSRSEYAGGSEEL